MEKEQKKIEDKRKEINEAKNERARCKIKYDTQIIILEAQREMVLKMESDNNRLFDEYKLADDKVQKLINEEKNLIEIIETKTESDES